MFTYLNSLPAEQSLEAYRGLEGLQSVQEKVKEVRRGSLGHASEMGDRVLQTLSTLTPAPFLQDPFWGPLYRACEKLLWLLG